MAAVAADASALIALAQIDRLPLLEQLFRSVMIPPAVALEVAPSLPVLPGWETHALERPQHPRVVAADLDVGETEVIALALELRAERVILDDLPARRLAQALGLAIMGTASVLFMGDASGFRSVQSS